jgi:putative membrane protein
MASNIAIDSAWEDAYFCVEEQGPQFGRVYAEPHAELWKGALAGTLAGLAGSYAMIKFQEVWTKLSDETPHAKSSGKHSPRIQDVHPGQDRHEGDDATVQAAELISEAVLNRTLSDREKKVAGPVMHHGFGAGVGALYGAAAEVVPATASGVGVPFGAAVWLGADEIAVPALGIGKPRNEVPFSKHLYALLSHVVYGATTELTRRGIRKLLR